MILLIKIWIVLAMLNVLIIWLDLRKSKSSRISEGEEILKQIFNNENETV